MTWEINRSHGTTGLLEFESSSRSISAQEWNYIRDSLADVWDWWAEGVFLRPQPKKNKYNTPDFNVPYVVELTELCCPLDPEAWKSSLPDVENTNTVDSRLGEAFFHLTALVHNELYNYACQQLPQSAEINKIEPTQRRRYQTEHQVDNILLVRFSPSGEDSNYFYNFCSRINSSGSRPEGFFPSNLFAASINLFEINLSGAYLIQVDLRGAYLIQANLRGADLRGADLIQANLSGAYLIQANLIQANLSGADLIQANLSGADLSGAYLIQANLSGADLSGADLIQANLSGADLREADLIQANLRGADLSEADLIQANLRGADLREADLIQANLRGADLSEANLSEANLIQANLIQANLIQANLSRAYLSVADLRGAYLSRADLSEADLSGADLRGAYLIEVRNLTPSQIRSTVNWEEANYQGSWDENEIRWILDQEANQKYIENLKSQTS